MMSGLLPRIYPYDSVSCTYQNFYAIFQLSHCLVFPYLPFFAWLLFQVKIKRGGGGGESCVW